MILLDDWKIKTVYKIETCAVLIYIYKYNNAGRREVAYFDKGNIKIKEYKDGDNIIPTLEIPDYIFNNLKDHLKKEETETKSELKATKYHLEDIRKLLKLS